MVGHTTLFIIFSLTKILILLAVLVTQYLIKKMEMDTRLINVMCVVLNSVVSGQAMKHVQTAYQPLKLCIILLYMVYAEFNSLQADFTTGTRNPEIQ
jgi:hypothetical protein